RRSFSSPPRASPGPPSSVCGRDRHRNRSPCPSAARCPVWRREKDAAARSPARARTSGGVLRAESSAWTERKEERKEVAVNQGKASDIEQDQNWVELELEIHRVANNVSGMQSLERLMEAAKEYPLEITLS